MTDSMPAIFFGHGNPMNALYRNPWTEGWRAIGRNIRQPKAILCVSAHWYIPSVAVTAMSHPRTIHDFGGFPRELFEVEYPAIGSRVLAGRVRELLGDDVILDERTWGLDHGTWSILIHVFPDADVPVVQLSIDETKSGVWHYEFAKNLAPLRDEGVLVIGSGNLVHNLHAYSWGRHEVYPFECPVKFENTAKALMASGNHVPLANYDSLGPDAMLSAPTPDHYLPLVYVLALGRESEPVTFPVEGYDGGSISMLTVRIG
ncbi:MAG: 4,5-DOPA dioxygenase extradiol [Pyrinomonadaceae bacterium]